MKAAHYEIRQKEVFDWPLAVAAVALKMSGSDVQTARVVLGYVAPVPWPSPEAEQVLPGHPVNEDTAQKAAEAALQNAKPLSTMDTKCSSRGWPNARHLESRTRRCRMIRRIRSL